MDVIGVPISLVDLDKAVQIILAWVDRNQSRFVCVRDAPSLVRAAGDDEWLRIQHLADMVTPDGMPLVWLAHLHGHKTVQRVCGSDLVDALCNSSQPRGIRHFFYGGKPGVAEAMTSRLLKKYPKLEIAGIYSPPFGEMSVEEDQFVLDLIKSSHARIVWVGISTPKQEYWMRDHVARIPGATLIGVGAAFDFHSGVIARAPKWMQRIGLEWLHRLIAEPRRLWRRYLVMAPQFVWAVAMQEFKNFWNRSPGLRLRL